MKVSRASILILAAFASSPVARGSEGVPVSRFETSLFTQHSSREEGTTNVAGLELKWKGRWERISLSVAVPWLRVEGAGSIVHMGGGSVRAPRGPAGNGPAVPAMQPILQGEGSSAWEAVGLGDARVAAAVRLDKDPAGGRWSLHGGVKFPTADESRGLGTGEADIWAGVTWTRRGWHADLELWTEWCSVGDPEGYDLEDGPAGGVLVGWPVGRVALAAGVEAGSAAYLGAPSRRSALLLVRGPAGRRSIWKIEARSGLLDASPEVGVAAGIEF